MELAFCTRETAWSCSTGLLARLIHESIVAPVPGSTTCARCRRRATANDRTELSQHQRHHTLRAVQRAKLQHQNGGTSAPICASSESSVISKRAKSDSTQQPRWLLGGRRGTKMHTPDRCHPATSGNSGWFIFAFFWAVGGPTPPQHLRHVLVHHCLGGVPNSYRIFAPQGHGI